MIKIVLINLMESTFVYSRDGIFEVINKGRGYFERLLMEIANT